MAALQASPSLGFSWQEHWSGFPFPSPMHESEKWKWSRQSFPTLSDAMDCSLQGSSVHGFSRHEYWSGVPLPSPTVVASGFICLMSYGIFPDQGSDPCLLHWQSDFLWLNHREALFCYLNITQSSVFKFPCFSKYKNEKEIFIFHRCDHSWCPFRNAQLQTVQNHSYSHWGFDLSTFREGLA